MSEHDRNGSAAGDPQDAGLSRLYREAARDAPPVHLDAAIRAAARREAGVRPQRLGAFAVSRWRLPVALAAVLVLSVSLVTVMMEEGGDDLSAPPPPRAAVPSSAPAQAPRGASGKRAEEPRRMLERAGSGRTGDKAEQQADRTRGNEAAGQPAEESGAAKPAAVASADAPRRAPLAAPERDAASAPRARRMPAAPEPAAAGGVPTIQGDAISDGTKNAATGQRLSPAVASEVRTLEAAPPAKWIDRVAALRRDGQDAEADELLAEFRRRFPDHPLPASIEK